MNKKLTYAEKLEEQLRNAKPGDEIKLCSRVDLRSCAKNSAEDKKKLPNFKAVVAFFK